MFLNEKRLSWILTASLLFVMWSGNFVFLLNNSGFHEKEFDRLNLNHSLGMNVVNYVNGAGSLNEAFNDREADHLDDVKNLFSKIKAVYYGFLLALTGTVAILFVKKKLDVVPDAFVRSGLISLFLLVALFLISLNFGSFFASIHRPFFEGGSWMFPTDSILIKTFPEEFFRSFTSNLVRLIFLNSAIFFGAGVFVKKRFSKAGGARDSSQL